MTDTPTPGMADAPVEPLGFEATSDVIDGFRHAVRCPYVPSRDAACDCHPIDESKAMRPADVLRVFAPLPPDEADALRGFAPQAEEADAKRLAEPTRTIEQRAWSIVHEAGPAWRNWYCTKYPNSKASERQLRDEMAHACVVAALKDSDDALAEAERRGAERMRAALQDGLVSIIVEYDCEQHRGPSSAFNALQNVWQKYRALAALPLLGEGEGSK